MSYWAVEVQSRAMELVQAWFGARFKTYRITPMLQVAPGDLPVLGIYITRERRDTEHWNQGDPHFNEALMLSFSGAVHVETGKQEQMSELENWMAELDDVLLKDSRFVNTTEGTSNMDRSSQFAKVGETTLYEIRIEWTLRRSQHYEPKVLDMLERVHVKTQFPDKAHADAGTPQLDREYELEQTRQRVGIKRP